MQAYDQDLEQISYIETENEVTEFISIPRGVYLSRTHQKKGRRKHAHTCIEMAYVLSGTAMHAIYLKDGTVIKEPLTMGNYYIIDYNASHILYDVSKDFFLVNFLFQPSFIDDSLDKYESVGNVLKVVFKDAHLSTLNESVVNRIYYDNDNTVRKIFDKAWDVYSQKLPGYRDLLRCYVSEILIFSTRSILPNDLGKKHAVVSIRDYINEHFSEDISLGKICKERCLNVSYTSRKFKEIIGVSFETYLQNIRIQNACTMLIETNDSVEAIVEKVGYTDYDSFRRVFKRILNTSPLKYRALFR